MTFELVLISPNSLDFRHMFSQNVSDFRHFSIAYEIQTSNFRNLMCLNNEQTKVVISDQLEFKAFTVHTWFKQYMTFDSPIAKPNWNCRSD